MRYSKFISALMTQVERLPQKRAPRTTKAVQSLKSLRPVIQALRDRKGFTFKEIQKYLTPKVGYKYSTSALSAVYGGGENAAYNWAKRKASEKAKTITPSPAKPARRRRGHALPQEVREAAIKLLKAGNRAERVASITGIAKATAYRLLHDVKNELEAPNSAPKSVASLQEIPKLFGEQPPTA